MLRNHLRIAVRTLWKQKGITAINVLGLAAGMAVCLLAGQLVWDQAAHDDFHPGADRIYRVTSDVTTLEPHIRGTSPAPLAPVLREGVTGLDTATRMQELHQTVVVDRQGYDVDGLYAEPSFFELFGFGLMAGDADEALAKPYSAVVTQRLARRLYGDENPLGQTFRLQGGRTVTVSGVVDRTAYRSHLAFDVLISFATLHQTRPDEVTNWRTRYSTYLRVNNDQAVASIEASLERLRRLHLPTLEVDEEHATYEQLVQVKSFQLEPLSSVPFSDVYNPIEEGTYPQLGIFWGFVLLILLVASFNYVNLSTARSLSRGREVGVRKTLGAHWQQVMGQFLAEAIIVALLALGLAAVFLQGLVPFWNQLLMVRADGLEIAVEPGLRFYALAALFAVGVGGLAGLYPAWRLSSFHPARVMKAGVQAKTPGAHWMTPRKVMIVVQFLIAFVVIVSALVSYWQARHVSTVDYPIRMDHVARIELQETDYGPFQQAARTQAGVRQVGAANRIPILQHGAYCRVDAPQRPDSMKASCYYMDYDATQLLDLPILFTEDFTEARFESGQTVLISEAAVRHFGFSSPQEALGQPLTLHFWSDEQQDVRIAGIVENFATHRRAASEHKAVFHYRPEDFELALAGSVPGQDAAVLDRLEATWEKVAVDPFKGDFLRAYLESTVGDPMAELGWVLGLLAGLTILISCLGLLGIVTYAVQTRTREIGIRKALGATVSSIVGLLSKEVLWVVGTAVCIGMPIAWIINRMMLRNFVRPIDFGPLTLLLVVAAIVALAFLAIASPTLRAAHTDPAQTLRSE